MLCSGRFVVGWSDLYLWVESGWRKSESIDYWNGDCVWRFIRSGFLLWVKLIVDE